MSASDAKTVSQFSPSAAVGREGADRYYREVHSRFARRTLRAMEHVLTYHTAIAEASYDLNSGWDAPPETFRYVTLRFRAGRTLGFTPDVREQVTQDHRRFLRDLRSFTVDEDVLVDRVDGQTVTVKYLFEYDRPPTEDTDAAPFHGLRLSFVGTGIGSSGIDTDPYGRVRSESGDPIRGLYAVGSCVALTAAGTGYNSGFALGRGLTLAYLVAQELGEQP